MNLILLKIIMDVLSNKRISFPYHHARIIIRCYLPNILGNNGFVIIDLLKKGYCDAGIAF
jgi:hypothetical protein